MVIYAVHGGICSQLCSSFGHPENSILPHDGLWTPCLPPSWQNLPTQSGETTLGPPSACNDAIAAHQVAQQKMKEQITSKFTPWKVGDKVWLETTNLHMGGPKKLQMKWMGPFEVKEVISQTAFHLHIPSRWKIHPVPHASLLMTYKETVEHSPNFLWPLPNLIDGEEEYKVKVIIRHQGRPGWHTFLVWWKGYSAAEDTWEPEQNLGNAKSLIEEYKITHPRDFLEYNCYNTR